MGVYSAPLLFEMRSHPPTSVPFNHIGNKERRNRTLHLKQILHLGILCVAAVCLYLLSGIRENISWLWKSPRYKFPDLYEAGISELQSGLDLGHFTSVELVQAYISRIEEVNFKGPQLRAVLEVNPLALSQAHLLDAERRKTGKRSPLHGIPVLLKDNIATLSSEGMNNTAGSFALLGSVILEDARVVKRLRAAGAIILGKLNISEFAHFRGHLASGWSGRGGQGTNAYYKNGDTGGSSSGSGVAASIGLGTVTLGSETDGSITSPSGNNNVVGIKPTLGLTSRVGVIPISEHQDTIGPMCRSVRDAAIVLNIIAGKDLNDIATLRQPPTLPDYTSALKLDSLKGKRIGVPRRVFLDPFKVHPSILEAFERALVIMRDLGATIIDPADIPSATEVANDGASEELVLNIDFKVQINEYLESLAKRPAGVNTLADIISFNGAHPELELPPGYESQISLQEAQATTGRNVTFFQKLELNQIRGGARGIDATLQEHGLDALVLPAKSAMTTTHAALAGYPIVTVPLGFYPDDTKPKRVGPQTFYPAPGIPFGLSFIGAAYTESDLISFAYAYEQKTKVRHARKAIPEAIPGTQLEDIVKLRQP